MREPKNIIGQTVYVCHEKNGKFFLESGTVKWQDVASVSLSPGRWINIDNYHMSEAQAIAAMLAPLREEEKKTKAAAILAEAKLARALAWAESRKL